MTLTHGNTRSAIISRIAERAFALATDLYVRESDLHDSSDINSREDQEIAFAHTLADAWIAGKAIEAWHVPGVNEFIANVA